MRWCFSSLGTTNAFSTGLSFRIIRSTPFIRRSCSGEIIKYEGLILYVIIKYNLNYIIHLLVCTTITSSIIISNFIDVRCMYYHFGGTFFPTFCSNVFNLIIIHLFVFHGHRPDNNDLVCEEIRIVTITCPILIWLGVI